jgi:hypothetical protein
MMIIYIFNYKELIGFIRKLLKLAEIHESRVVFIVITDEFLELDLDV